MGIQHKRSYTAGYVPTVAQVDKGELFVNLADNIIYSQNDAGEIVPVGASSGNNAMALMRQHNREMFAASGFVHYGRQHSASADGRVNEGMSTWDNSTLSAVGNKLAIGKKAPDPVDITGTSKTGYAVTHIAGFITELIGNRRGLSDDHNYCVVRLPDAPDGTVISDVGTGGVRSTGNVQLDLKTEVDPKYGDVAADHNEAVARAFEGTCVNGDFRDGGTGWGLGSDGRAVVTADGVLQFRGGSTGATQSIWNTYNATIDGYYPAGTPVEVEVDFENSVGYINLILRSSGYSGVPQQQNVVTLRSAGNGRAVLKMTMNANAYNLRFIVETNSGGGNGQVDITAVRFRRATEEVVIDRHDMFGGEFFLEAVTDANPYIYPKGMIQSQETAMNGIPTSDSARPDTYYAVFEGDTGFRGKGLNYTALTAAQKAEVLGDPTNNLYIDEFGNLLQWRCRQRSFASLVNGAWYRLGSSNAYGQTLACAEPNVGYAGTQGMKDSAPTFYDGGVVTTSVWYPTTHDSGSNSENLGVYKAGLGGVTNDTTVAVNGECYFHVWGVVPRLNKGAYHPSSNPNGTAYWAGSTGGGVVTGYSYWNSNLVADTGLNETANAFKLSVNGEALTAKKFASTYADPQNGSIRSGIGGRFDGRKYDQIYQEGFGGVDDYRLSAWDMSDKGEAAKIMRDVANGSYRGQERAPEWRIRYSAHPESSSSAIYLHGVLGNKYDIIGNTTDNIYTGRRAWVRIKDAGSCTLTAGTSTGVWYDCAIYGHSGNSAITINPNTGTTRWIDAGDSSTLTIDIAAAVYSDNAVSGNYMAAEVMGSPDAIESCPDLRNGWLGGWMGTPAGSASFTGFTRKVQAQYSDTMSVWVAGATNWTGYTRPVDTVRNRVTDVGVGEVGYKNVEVKAFLTTPRTTDPYAFGSFDSYARVWAYMGYASWQGVDLVNSLIDKVPTHNAGGKIANDLTLTNLRAEYNGDLTWSGGADDNPEHAPLDLVHPNNDSPACKALWHPTSTNQQLELAFLYNELIHAGAYSGIGVVDINDTNPTIDGAAGTIYRVQGTWNNALNFKLLMCESNFLASWNDAGWVGVGNGIYRYATAPSGVDYLREFGSSADWWGTDNIIDIESDHRIGSYLNFFGRNCRKGNAKLSKPYGYTRNQARASNQFGGIDL